MKNLILVSGILVIPYFCIGQLSGLVSDSASGEKISGAVVMVENSFLQTFTDADGKFSLLHLRKNPVRIRISQLGYEARQLELIFPAEDIAIALIRKTYLSEEVVVTATRASDHSPTAFSVVKKEELEKLNTGKDLPYLISTLPSVVTTSDAGAGVGYAGLRIRGSDATRVNVTINGIPVNDAEEHGVFWVDLPDLASSISSIQIQRGIGTSTNGAGAFGASLNILTTSLSPETYATVSSSYGTFNTWKNTVQFGTGLLRNKFAFEGRLSKISSDGFVDRAASDLKSFYLSGGYYGKKSTLRTVIFSGKEITYQSWNGVPEAKLNNDPGKLTVHYYNNLGYLYHTREDSINLFGSDNRTYNYFNYNNQTDNYQQDNYQLHYSYAPAQRLFLNASLHYTKGNGYYEEFKNDQLFSSYLLEDVVIGSDTITTTDLVRQKWLDNDFYGFTLSSNYENDQLEFSAGAAGNRYAGAHFDQVVWAQYAGNNVKDFIYSDNDAEKNEFNVFARAIYSPGKSVHIFGDIQFRTLSYSFPGADSDLILRLQDVKLNFINPKVGITYNSGKRSRLYASFAIGNKEPIRGDYISSSPVSRPGHEQMQDIEAGYRFSGRSFSAGANFYFMNYKDQLILTGEINDVGAYTRMNVDKSYRSGIELELAWKTFKSVSLHGNLTLSRNRIETFREFLDDYDAGGQQVKVYNDSPIAFSPDLISSAVISWMTSKIFSLDLVSKYIGSQYLDNTGDENRKLEDYFLNDVLLNYDVPVNFCKGISFRLAAYNIFNKEYSSNGYTYGYIYGGNRIQESFYFPQAGRHFLGGVEWKF